MRVFKTKAFARFARKEGLSDSILMDAIGRAETKPDADLGGGVIKQRIARPGQGRSGGYRTIIVYRWGEMAIFVFGYAKSVQGNLSAAEERGFKDLAAIYLGLSSSDIEELVAAGKFVRVKDDV